MFQVHLFWLCPSMECFEWFFDILHELEMEKRGLIDIHIYLTRGWKKGKITDLLCVFNHSFISEVIHSIL